MKKKKAFIHRSKVEGQFTIIPNSIARNKQLSYGAKGILLTVLSNAPGWIVTNAYLRELGTEGAMRITTLVQELEAAGYAVCHVTRTHKGVITGQEWHFHDVPVPEAERSTPRVRGAKIRQKTRVTGTVVAGIDPPQKIIRQNIQSLSKDPFHGSCSQEQGKVKKPKAPKTPEEIGIPTYIEFERFILNNNLTFAAKRGVARYHKWVDDGWHLWKEGRRWELIENWQSTLIGLDEVIRIEDERSHEEKKKRYAQKRYGRHGSVRDEYIPARTL